MSTSKRNGTVLVLGAGASSDYGFPLGKHLRDIICDHSINSPTKFVEHGFSEKEAMAFGRELSRSGYTSVDWFLEKFPDFMPIGRIAIALGLIPFEAPDRLFPHHAPPNHWYEDFFNRYWSYKDGSLVLANQITILTFNYDRSLEFYLKTVGEVRGKASPNTASFQVKGPYRLVINQGPTIIHLHGQLGHLDGTDAIRPYSADLSPEPVKVAADGLQLLSEADPDSPAFAMARDAIRACSRLYFLGFGFNQKSVERLIDLSSEIETDGLTVGGTSAGFARSQWSRIEQDVLHNRWKQLRAGNSVHGFLAEHEILP